MRRRRAAGELPPELLVFEGFRYQTSRAWVAAFSEFCAARDAWAKEHEGAVLAPIEVNGDCPFDWTRFRPAAG